MKKKKLLALFLTGAMTLSLAACGSSPAQEGDVGDNAAVEEKGGEKESTQSGDAVETVAEEAAGSELEGDLTDIIPEQTVTLDVYDQLANYSGEQTGWFGQIMLDKFNVKLNIIPENDGVYDTRIAPMV